MLKSFFVLLALFVSLCICLLARPVGALLSGHGININNYRTTLPVKKGLSSSAAICVLVARAFNRSVAERAEKKEPNHNQRKPGET